MVLPFLGNEHDGHVAGGKLVRGDPLCAGKSKSDAREEGRGGLQRNDQLSGVKALICSDSATAIRNDGGSEFLRLRKMAREIYQK